MKILIVGGGGREHALAWKIAQSPLVDTLFAAPGNPGIARHASCVAIGVEAYDDLVAFARRERVDLVVVGPEVPLVAGLADHLAAAGLAVGDGDGDGLPRYWSPVDLDQPPTTIGDSAPA